MVANLRKIASSARLYGLSTAGAVAVVFGLMVPVLVGSVGVSVDIAQSYLVKQRLGHALDAAALAAAASAATDEEELEQAVLDFVEMNYPAEKIGAAYDIEAELNGTELTVRASARLDTTFMRIWGHDHVTVSAETIVQREVRGLEVVLVLDNTGSMATNNNIGALKQASESFVNILFDRAGDPDDVKIGIVPYSNSVRVGRYGLGLNPDGSPYDGDPFVTLPPGVSYSTSHTGTGWYGCVVEHMDNNYYQPGATHQSNTKGHLWRSGSSWRGHGWDPATANNDPYPQDVEDTWEGPWDIYYYGKIISNNQRCSDYSGFSNARCSSCTSTSSSGRCNQTYCYCWASQPNQQCPIASVLPLTSDQSALLSRINQMSPEGNTAGNVGMIWGQRLISPEPPFEEGAEWDSEYWDKAVIMMTDGDNTIDSGSTGYSYYGPGSHNNMTVYKMNERFSEVCEALKEQDVIIYTITFYSNIDDTTKEYYEECATPGKHFDAPTQEQLVQVFEQISRELSNLHIKK